VVAGHRLLDRDAIHWIPRHRETSASEGWSRLVTGSFRFGGTAGAAGESGTVGAFRDSWPVSGSGDPSSRGVRAVKVIGAMGGETMSASTEIVELSPETVPIRATRSARWIGVLIAALAAVVCLGLAGGQLPSRTQATEAGDPSPSTAVPLPSAAGSPAVAATARVISASGIARAVVSGAASPGVDHVTVSLRIGGRIVATAEAVPGAAGPGHDPFVPWSGVLDVPARDLGSDAQAILDVTWSADGTSIGSVSLALSLGDGRGRRGEG
jgi:hypothetical protein